MQSCLEKESVIMLLLIYQFYHTKHTVFEFSLSDIAVVGDEELRFWYLTGSTKTIHSQPQNGQLQVTT